MLHQIGFRDGDRRPIVYRASIAEMVVPYGDPTPVRYWQNYFDTGEYLFGQYANSLELGCDCLGEITYLDAGRSPTTTASPRDDPQRHLHARGGLRRPVEAHRHVQRHRPRPAASAAW